MLPILLFTVVNTTTVSAKEPATAKNTATEVPAPAEKNAFILHAKVIIDFPGKNGSEMSLKAGEVVEVVKRGPPDGWSIGQKGCFPSSYVEFIQKDSPETPANRATTPTQCAPPKKPPKSPKPVLSIPCFNNNNS